VRVVTFLRGLAAVFILTAVAELVAIAFTPIGVAGLFAATFGFFFGGLLVGLAALMEDVRALREAAERALP
jgi:hypothetical protein